MLNDGRLGEPRQTGRRLGAQQTHGERGERDAGGATEGREHRTLGDEQPRETPCAGAERDADGELTAACFATDEQQAGDVGAGDEQHEHHRAEDDEQYRAHAAGDLLFYRYGERAEADVGHVAELLQLGDERSQLSIRGRGARARRELSDGVETVARAILGKLGARDCAFVLCVGGERE